MEPKVENRFAELANRLEKLEKESAKKLGLQEIKMIKTIVRSLRLGFAESVVTLYLNELDKFRELPEIAKIIEEEVIGKERVAKEFSFLIPRSKNAKT
jgi:hypothetical protein